MRDPHHRNRRFGSRGCRQSHQRQRRQCLLRPPAPRPAQSTCRRRSCSSARASAWRTAAATPCASATSPINAVTAAHHEPPASGAPQHCEAPHDTPQRPAWHMQNLAEIVQALDRKQLCPCTPRFCCPAHMLHWMQFACKSRNAHASSILRSKRKRARTHSVLVEGSRMQPAPKIAPL